MQPEPPLISERRQGIAVLTMCRPRAHNALDAGLLAALAAEIAALAEAPVRAVVLTGVGAAFCTGVDLAWVVDGGDPFAALDLAAALRSLPVPTVAAVNGAAVTGGFELALNCDLRIGCGRSRFVDTHGLIGIHPAWGMSALLPRAVGAAMARRISEDGHVVRGAEALECGLVARHADRRDLLEAAVTLALEAAEGGIPLGPWRGDDARLAADLAAERRDFDTWRRELPPAGFAGIARAFLAARGSALPPPAPPPSG